MEGSCGGGNRRQFPQDRRGRRARRSLRVDRALDRPLRRMSPAVPLVTLGKTGQKVTKLGMGTSWALDQSFVQAAIFAGVRYIDTSEGIREHQGRASPRRGDRTDVNMRKDRLPRHQERRLPESLRRRLRVRANTSTPRASNACKTRLRRQLLHSRNHRRADSACSATRAVKKPPLKPLKKAGKIRFCRFELSTTPMLRGSAWRPSAKCRLARPDHVQVQLPRRRRQGPLRRTQPRSIDNWP